MLFADPVGNMVNFFTPVTPEAKARFAERQRWARGLVGAQLDLLRFRPLAEPAHSGRAGRFAK